MQPSGFSLLRKENGYSPVYCGQCGTLLSIGPRSSNHNFPSVDSNYTYYCPFHGELGMYSEEYKGIAFQPPYEFYAQGL